MYAAMKDANFVHLWSRSWAMELTPSGPPVSGAKRCAHRLGDAHRRRRWNGCSTFERELTRFASRLEPRAQGRESVFPLARHDDFPRQFANGEEKKDPSRQRSAPRSTSPNVASTTGS